MKKLNLGCGRDYKKGWINLDNSKLIKSDVIWNLEKTPLPFKNSEFDYIYSNHVLEHIENIIQLIKEIHRIGKKIQ